MEAMFLCPKCGGLVSELHMETREMLEYSVEASNGSVKLKKPSKLFTVILAIVCPECDEYLEDLIEHPRELVVIVDEENGTIKPKGAYWKENRDDLERLADELGYEVV